MEIAREARERETSASQLPARFQAPPDANKSHNFPNDPGSCTPRARSTNREHFLFPFDLKVGVPTFDSAWSSEHVGMVLVWWDEELAEKKAFMRFECPIVKNL